MAQQEPVIEISAPEEDLLELDEAFIPLLATKANPSVTTAGAKLYNGLDFKTEVLCEVLELDVGAVAAMDTDERRKVLEEAKRSVKMFPDLDNVQRVDVNRALVLLKDGDYEAHEEYLNTLPLDERAEAFEEVNQELAPHGRYSPTLAVGKDGLLDVRYEWTSAQEEYPLSPLSPLIEQHLSQYQHNINAIALRKLAGESEELDGEGSDSETEWVVKRSLFG